MGAGAAGGQKEPAAQGWHVEEVVAPTAPLKVPAVQFSQAGAPAGLCVPAGHCAGAAAPSAQKEPAGQGAQGKGKLKAPTAPLKVPAAQDVQAAAPAALWAPAGQGEGFTEEGGQKEPAGHSTGAPEAQK